MIKNTRTLIPWIKQSGVIQPQITYAHKSYIYNENKKILDFTSGQIAVNLGHNNSYIINGVRQQMLSGISYVPSNFSTFAEKASNVSIIDITSCSCPTFFASIVLFFVVSFRFLYVLFKR